VSEATGGNALGIILTGMGHDGREGCRILRDAGGRIVYSWKMKAPAPSLAPGAKINFNEAKLDVPRAASQLEVGWADQARE